MKPILALIFILSMWPLAAVAQNDFLRFIPGEVEWEGELQTSVSRYENSQGQVVELAATVHIADGSYYASLNDYFQSLDIVLYELVTDEDGRPQSRNSNQNLSTVSFLQSTMAAFLQLEFQLNAIDYTAGNLVRADLSARQLRALMESKNESFFSMFLNMAIAQMAAEQRAIEAQDIEPSDLSVISLITALAAENQSQALKYLVARELGRSGDLALNPAAESQLTILGDRNQVVLSLLQETLSSGEQRVGIFYGAAHMQGLERELLMDMGFALVSRSWLTAWQIP